MVDAVLWVPRLNCCDVDADTATRNIFCCLACGGVWEVLDPDATDEAELQLPTLSGLHRKTLNTLLSKSIDRFNNVPTIRSKWYCTTRFFFPPDPRV